MLALIILLWLLTSAVTQTSLLLVWPGLRKSVTEWAAACILCRSEVKEDLGAFPAKLVLGQPLHAPGEFLPKSPSPCFRSLVFSPHPYLDSFLVSGPVHHCQPDTFVIHKGHHYIRCMMACLGYLNLLESSQKHFVLDFSRRRETVCVERHKPAHVLVDDQVVH